MTIKIGNKQITIGLDVQDQGLVYPDPDKPEQKFSLKLNVQSQDYPPEER